MEQIIEITKDAPFIVKADKDQIKVAKLSVRPLTFVEFCATLGRAAALRTKNDSVRKMMMREQMRSQVKAYDAKGKPVAVTPEDLLSLPRAYATQLMAALRNTGDEPNKEGQRGEVIGDGDGIGTPVLYRLGRPITTGSEAKTIEELEFSARTIGDIEDVLAEIETYDQAVMLIRRCAKPVGGDVTLIALPSWAVDQVSLADGITIAEKVLPRFL